MSAKRKPKPGPPPVDRGLLERALDLLRQRALSGRRGPISSEFEPSAYAAAMFLTYGVLPPDAARLLGASS